MNIACGVDIVYIPNIAKMEGKHALLQKFFHQNEIGNATAEHLAGLIAAKEAFFKALRTSPKFLEIQIKHKDSGKPEFIVSPEFKKFTSVDVSISHDKDYAIAFVILEQ